MQRRELLKRGVGLGMALALAPLGSGTGLAAEEKWVQTWQQADLWSNTGPTAVSFGKLRPFSYLLIQGEVENSRLYVYNPKTKNFAYVDAGLVGPSAAPPQSYLDGPTVLQTLNMPSRASGTASIYREPIADEVAWAEDVDHNSILLVKDEIEADDGTQWYRLQDGTYVLTDQARVPERVQPQAGKWIDVTLTGPTILTAYDNGQPRYSALAIHG